MKIPERAAARAMRAQSIHHSNDAVLKLMQATKTDRVTLVQKRNFMRSLAQLKRNHAEYDFGPTQLKTLEILVQKTRRAKTFSDWVDIHRLTCLLGLPKQ